MYKLIATNNSRSNITKQSSSIINIKSNSNFRLKLSVNTTGNKDDNNNKHNTINNRLNMNSVRERKLSIIASRNYINNSKDAKLISINDEEEIAVIV
jgi:hypothetical protein